MITIKSEEEVKIMREAGRVVGEVLIMLAGEPRSPASS